MEEWVVRLGPWLRLLRQGATLALQQVRGRPRLLAVAAVATVSSVTIYKYVTKNFGKWKRLGVPYEEGHFPYGSFDLSSLSSMLVALPALHLKHSPSSPYFGWFMFGQPVLNITDPDLLRAVQVRDFNNFVERSSYDGDMFEHGGEYDRLWSKQLTALKGEEWKHVRATFSPIFTSGKMKGMLNFIKLTADNLVEKFEGSADGREEVALKVSHSSPLTDSPILSRACLVATPWTASPPPPLAWTSTPSVATSPSSRGTPPSCSRAAPWRPP